MSRNSKWKLETSKVKVVFRLQFHATNIPQAGWDKLFISFIPCDTGKATAKTTKANVRNGTCKWADPIYETTRLLHDAKNKQYDEKLYKFVVAMGSSRASILGEATIDLADYADALKPSAISLPLLGCNSGSVLHVTVQLLTSKTGFREFEQQREQREKGLDSSAENKHDDSTPGKETSSNQLNKVNARVRIKDPKELNSVEEEVGSHEEYADSALGFDDSSNTSESLYAVHESDSLRSNASGDLNELPHRQSPRTEKGDISDNDVTMVYEENHRLKGSLDLAESIIIELKQEIISLQAQANEIGVETQKFSHFLASEISSSEEMAKEVSFLKAECLKFKDAIERLKDFKTNAQVTGEEDSDRQRRFVSQISNLENRIRELQQKTYLGFRERDIMFFHLELEELIGILKSIKDGRDIAEIGGTCLSTKREQLAYGTELDLDLSLPETLLHQFSIPPLISHENDSIAAIDVMKMKISHLTRELDEAKADRESLARKMDQMECYYEALIQELEDNQKQMLGEFQNLRNEHSTCLYTIVSSKAETESMRQDMSQQLLQLSVERSDLDSLNKELERRAVTAEAALRRARLNYSIAVNKLQKDLELLSSQVVSMFETNENLIKQAFSEEPEAASLMQYRNSNNAGVEEHPLGEDIVLEDLKRTLYLQNELYQKVEGELHEIQFVTLHLDVFSTTLQETLLEANAQIGHMKGNLEADRVVYKNSLSAARSDILDVKQKYKSDIQKMEAKINVSNTLFEKLQFDLESVANKLQLSSKVEEKYAQESNELLADHALIESELLNLISKHGILAQEISGLEDLAEELETSKSAIADLTQEKHGLVQESIKLASERDSLAENLKCLEDQLQVEQNVKEKLDAKVKDLTSKLNSMREKSLECDEQQAELVHLRQLTTDLELEKSRLNHLLLMREECVEKLQEESSCSNHLQNQLVEMDGDMLAADVKFTFLLHQFEDVGQEFFQRVKYSEGCLEELQMRYHEVEAKEEHYNKENVKLKMIVKSLQSELEASVAENKFSSEANDVMRVQIEEHIENREQYETATKDSRGVNEATLLEGVLQQMDEKPFDVSNTHLDNINLRSSLEHLHEELERMKNENSLVQTDQIDPDFLQAELLRLHNANEELRSIFPLYNEVSSRGNALERVLALEIELAETLRAKSKSNIHLQSSFVRQHSDEEALLKSFGDIHELIKEMLELKGRYTALETELKEMHDRYSRLSLQFADVEGERQKLKMTLKNVRASRKLHLNRSSSAAIADRSP